MGCVRSRLPPTASREQCSRSWPRICARQLHSIARAPDAGFAARRSSDESDEITRLNQERAGIDRRIERLTALLSETETPAPFCARSRSSNVERQGARGCYRRREAPHRAGKGRSPYHSGARPSAARRHGRESRTPCRSPSSRRSSPASSRRVILDPGESSLLCPVQNTSRNRGFSGVPKGIRTPVAAVKGQCPRPLDDGDEVGSRWGWERQAPLAVRSLLGPARKMVEPGGIEPPTSTMPL